MTLHDADCGRCGGAGGLSTDAVNTHFDVLCLVCASTLSSQHDLEVTASGVVA